MEFRFKQCMCLLLHDFRIPNSSTGGTHQRIPRKSSFQVFASFPLLPSTDTMKLAPLTTSGQPNFLQLHQISSKYGTKQSTVFFLTSDNHSLTLSSSSTEAPRYPISHFLPPPKPLLLSASTSPKPPSSLPSVLIAPYASTTSVQERPNAESLCKCVQMPWHGHLRCPLPFFLPRKITICTPLTLGT